MRILARRARVGIQERLTCLKVRTRGMLAVPWVVRWARVQHASGPGPGRGSSAHGIPGPVRDGRRACGPAGAVRGPGGVGPADTRAHASRNGGAPTRGPGALEPTRRASRRREAHRARAGRAWFARAAGTAGRGCASCTRSMARQASERRVPGHGGTPHAHSGRPCSRRMLTRFSTTLESSTL
jgi:hypothetical protein